jgi:hypothetical protein
MNYVCFLFFSRTIHVSYFCLDDLCDLLDGHLYIMMFYFFHFFHVLFDFLRIYIFSNADCIYVRSTSSNYGYHALGITLQRKHVFST